MAYRGEVGDGAAWAGRPVHLAVGAGDEGGLGGEGGGDGGRDGRETRELMGKR